VVKECGIILHCWEDHGFELPALSDLARNTFWLMATSAVSKQVFGVTGHVMNSKKAN